MRAAGLCLAVLTAAATLACRSKQEPVRAVASASARVVKPVDRLLPGELSSSQGQVFGLAVPNGMTVKGAFGGTAYLEGNVAPDALANYVRDRVDVERVEIGVARTLFPNARIRGGAPDRSYEIEVVAGNASPTRLVVRDVTPHGANGPPTMTEEERWRQAGRGPDGKPLDMAEFK